MSKDLFHFHPSLSKRIGGFKSFDGGVAHGLNVNGIPSIAPRQGNSRSLVFLIASTLRQVALKPDI